MQTECTPKLFAFEAVGRRAVVAQFDGGTITSNAGALLLGPVNRGLPSAATIASTMVALTTTSVVISGSTNVRPK
jgi:hypothetical protein